MSTIYQCDKCGAQSSDAGSITKVDLVDMCKQCRTVWAGLKKVYLDAYLKGSDATNIALSDTFKQPGKTRRKNIGKQEDN